jgi:pimeloyl-ACP methyl ester carboxylesterase
MRVTNDRSATNRDRSTTIVRGSSLVDAPSIAGCAVYLGSQPDPVFAMLHVPTAIPDDATGVVLCPPFGWEDMCTYRTRRAWAIALAQAGHPAIRIDLPGTNDSAGSPRDPDRLEAWTTAVADAAGWLRQHAGCRRVAGLGIGLGGMLVWLAASEGAPIDDLVLWGTTPRGHRLVREMRAGTQIHVDLRLEPAESGASDSADGPSDSQDGGLVEIFGRYMTPETVESIAQLDLPALPLEESTRRRVLLFVRSASAVDERVRRHFASAGVELSVADGDEYQAMMQYAAFAQVPEAAIANSISWLSASDGAADFALTGPSVRPVRAFRSLRLRQDGVPIRETPLTIDVGQEKLFAIVTEPAGGDPPEICAVLFNSGSDRRTGPCRLWVETARRWAAKGIPTVRIDQPGIGDAESEQSYAKLKRFYEPRIAERTRMTLDQLEALGLPGRFVLAGACSGGVWSFDAGVRDPRVAGVFAINLPFFFFTRCAVHVLHGWWVRRERRPDDSLIKVALLTGLKRAARWLLAARRALLQARFGTPDKLDRALSQLQKQGTEFLLMFRIGEPLYDLLRDEKRIERLEAMRNVQIRRIPGYDRGLRPLALQRYVSDELDAGLARVVVSERQRAIQDHAQVLSYTTATRVLRNRSTARTPA